jgi:hypothetical protein
VEKIGSRTEEKKMLNGHKNEGGKCNEIGLYRCAIFSWTMIHICANDEYRCEVRVGATNPSLVYLHVK